MELSGSKVIDAPRQRVWEALLDPEVLKACVPGCQEMSGSPEDGFEATVVQKVGPVKATFRGEVSLRDCVPPESVKLEGEGKGGAAGFAKGAAACRLSEEEGDRTRLDYDVEAKVGGKLAQLGSRVVDGFARKMADEFFARFQAQVEGPATAETDGEAEEPMAGDGVPASEATNKRKWFGLRAAD